ncbi:hemerythrin domain-containing protein [Chitinophaga alhagiae]|uniref:hemerythrin domain-containing protein n=1 Tax=Chitinophaga alhagiae TaxID=2203219 RepID=UPI000E5C01E7|nr:hemerythrin domain-containing protein [Chitinophaga alhagiae]
MQRHPNLVPLSHEHKSLLFVCRYLKKDAAPYEGYPLDAVSKMAYMVKVFQEIMVPHIQKEDYLFEQCRGHRADMDALLDELIAEHRIISGMYSALVDSADPVEAMDQLARSLEDHIRKEERVVFEKMQEELPEVIAALRFE